MPREKYSPGKLTEEELQEPVNRLIEQGDADMQTIFEKWVEKGIEKKCLNQDSQD